MTISHTGMTSVDSGIAHIDRQTDTHTHTHTHTQHRHTHTQSLATHNHYTCSLHFIILVLIMHYVRLPHLKDIENIIVSKI